MDRRISPHLLPETTFKLSTTMSLAVLALIFPFSVYHLSHGNIPLGVAGLYLELMILFDVWASRYQAKWLSRLVWVGLYPGSTLIIAGLIYTHGVIGVLWCYPAITIYYMLLTKNQALAINAMLLMICLPLVVLTVDVAVATRAVATISIVSILTHLFVMIIEDQKNKLQAQAYTDPLTGLYNRNLLEHAMNAESERQSRLGVPASLIMLDLDFFKDVNDRFGHSMGDLTLKKVGEFLKNNSRETDHVFRIGGEEFLVVLSDTDLDDAHAYAEKVRTGIRDLEITNGLHVTASFGVAAKANEETVSVWFRRADQNLYTAKATGRDRVVS